MKNYLGLITDHTISMRTIARAAARDFNGTVDAIEKASTANNQDTILTHVKCGHEGQGIAHRAVVNSTLAKLQRIPESSYPTNAPSTPLFDSVWMAIDSLEAAPDRDDPEVSFLVLATTDGGDNSSRRTARELAARMKDLQKTDRWTFVFRVPMGEGRHLVSMGIPGGNVLEWDQTDRGVAVAAAQTEQAMDDFMKGRASGQKSTTKFYANLQDVSIEDLQTFATNGQLTDISSEVKYFPVTAKDAGEAIRTFVEAKLGGQPMAKGAAFYQLVKTEPKVQANKRIAIRNKATGAVYAGDAARQMLALPTLGTVRLAPDELGDFEVFIQSTSVNRKLDAGTKLMYWDQVGKAFKEGISAR